MKESRELFVEEYAGRLYPNVSEGLFYENDAGRLLLGDCMDVMQSLEEGSVDMIFADPPYNIGKSRDWDCWSSKDRIDKVFMDKLFYNRIRRVDIPHFAVFLNDVQRKKTKDERRGFGVSQTFMQGHFKAYSLAMTPLDGVYYCDLRPVMQTDPFLKREIKRLD